MVPRRRRSTVFYVIVSLAAIGAIFNAFHHQTEEIPIITPQSHLFENTCRFAYISDIDPSIERYVRIIPNKTCTKIWKDVFVISEELTFKWIVPHVAVSCSVYELVGSLRPRQKSFKINKIKQIPKQFNEFWINADNYVISCMSDNSVIYEKPFIGLHDVDVSTLIVEGSRSIKRGSPYDFSKLSFNILTIDSVSRSQFNRFMAKSKQVMQKLGFINFKAYNKVGDNSCINLLALLADQVDEAKLYENEIDGDVDIRSILPYNATIDPDNIRFLWKSLKDATTMFNDEIGHTSRGIFHYPSKYFKAGFKKKPTDHYYRPYYVYLYKKLSDKWKLCYDDRVLAVDFLDPWYQFASKMAHRQHFGFTFVTTITHDNPNFLQLLDEPISRRLQKLQNQHALDNSVMIIMGDHGNRIHPIQRTFGGNIEERNPLMSIYLPPKLRNQFPSLYQTFVDNSNRVTSNFDVYETLLQLIERRMNDTHHHHHRNGSRGQSLFNVIPTDRQCLANSVVSNFCLCMEEVSLEDEDNWLNKDLLSKTSIKYLNDYADCVDINSIVCQEPDLQPYTTNAQVQAGLRNKKKTAQQRLMTAPRSSIIFLRQSCHMQLRSHHSIDIIMEYRINYKKQIYNINHEPMITNLRHPTCSQYRHLQHVCDCLKQNNNNKT